MKLSIAALFFVITSCNTADGVAGTWRIEITTDGGFTGRGIGSATRDPDTIECRTKLPRLVAAAKPERWKAEYRNERGADLVRYTLTLTRDGKSYTTSFEGEGHPDVPADLRALFEEAWKKC